MAQAYDFTLDRMGLDLNFYSVWNDYITFLRSAQVQGSYAESQKITATRRVYQRAIATPMLGIETLWRDYCLYENSINTDIAKKFIEERTSVYSNARRVAKEFEAITKGLSKNMPSVPPQNTAYEVKQVELWKKYIQWEKDNPLRTEDPIVITKRVMFAYEQCLLCLGHHPDIWYEAASYLEQASKHLSDRGDQEAANQFANETAAMYERGIAVLKDNMMLYFAYADYEEGRGKMTKVNSIYKKLISLKSVDPTLSYIQFMRFCRRSENIADARIVFKLAREDTRISHQVYVAAAMLEYFCSKDLSIAHKIFDLGLKRFPDSAEFVQCYLDFMSYLNEDNNTRVLFERALGTTSQIPREKSHTIWAKFLQFESQVGNLASIQKVEKRRLKALEEFKEFQGHETSLLIDRYRFLDLFPCSQSELTSLGYRDLIRMNMTTSGVHGFFTEEMKLGSETAVTLPGIADTGLLVNKKPTYPKPDTSQMLPFKPKAYPRSGSHVVPGGEFPPPPAASSLVKLLPPPECFHGPFVNINKFMDHMLELELPEDYFSQILNESEQLGDNIDPGTALSIELASSANLATTLLLNRKRSRKNSRKNKKRHLNRFGDSESEEDDDDDQMNMSSDDDEDDDTGRLIKNMHQEALLMKPQTTSVEGTGSKGFMDLFRIRQAKKQLK
ncbi:Cleavage stimulation factor subunit 3 [Cichlidogyrus casuarinus]|uniref:Cleavage stimulation factor subunit 3 n=1 Tax=Cichlidogyrus casuarinus TaxID=1844966 RepID=A0ABD2QE42_9PLAT